MLAIFERATLQNPVDNVDCLVIGGGPAGLTAAIYLARYRRTVRVFDEGRSRAAWIPKSHNYPGFPTFFSGRELRDLLLRQAEAYSMPAARERVTALERTASGFTAIHEHGRTGASRVLLATGIVDKAPDLDHLDDAVHKGIVRYCPVCDAYEACDRSIAVLGTGAAAISKARFLRHYSRDVTLLSSRELTSDELAEAEAADIAVRPAAGRLDIRDGAVRLASADDVRDFDVLYPALVCEVASGLAARLGAATNSVGCLTVDEHQRTSVEGIYAAGDVVSDLHQITVATGHSAIAATHIHNNLPFDPRR